MRNLKGMATGRRKAERAKWKGDGVEVGPAGAERAADRAEGKTAVSVADAAGRVRQRRRRPEREADELVVGAEQVSTAKLVE